MSASEPSVYKPPLTSPLNQRYLSFLPAEQQPLLSSFCYLSSTHDGFSAYLSLERNARFCQAHGSDGLRHASVRPGDHLRPGGVGLCLGCTRRPQVFFLLGVTGVCSGALSV
jgi:hypothetical protein